MTTEFIKDFNGNEVRPGDEIMYITSSGHVPQINFGTVDSFKEVEKDNYYRYNYPYGCKIRVATPKISEWDRGWALLEKAPIFKKGEVL